jgi:hypothetical protein
MTPNKNMSKIELHLDLLGRRATDRVTGFRGVVSSISHDLYGCVQAGLTPSVDKDGKKLDGMWLDICRLQVEEGKPVMERPDWEVGSASDGRHGPAEKPEIN